MKKLLAVLLALAMLFAAAACGSNNTNNADNTNSGNEAAPDKVAGTVCDFGRFSALVPEGWEKIDTGEEGAGYNAILVKGTASQFMQVPTLSITYGLPSDMLMSGKAFSENVEELGEFDLGTHHWSAWSGSFIGMEFSTAESFGKDGTLIVSVQPFGGKKLTFEDPEIKAVLESITTRPTVEVDWITIKDGIAAVALPAVEGYEWTSGFAMYTDDIEVTSDIVDGNAVITPESGTGGYSTTYDLYNEDQTLTMGTAEIKLGITDAKVDAVYDAVLTMYDEPQSTEDEDYEDDTDYEALAVEFCGTWKDEKNGITITITKDDSREHGCLIEMSSDGMQMSASGTFMYGDYVEYESAKLNGNDVETYGTFFTFDDQMRWGFDGEVFSFENEVLLIKQK